MNKFFLGIMGALALTACSSEEVIPDQKPIEGEGKPRYMSVSIRNANPGTRAEGELYEEGYGFENDVKSLRFYFFDGDGKPIEINSAKAQSYFDCESTDINNTGSPDMNQTVEKILNAVIVINSADASIGTKIKQMVAVANFNSIKTTLKNQAESENLSLEELQSIVGNETTLNVAAYANNGFVLTSSSYYDNGETCAVEIKETDIKESRELALAQPVDVYVERVVAKVRVKTAWNDDFKNNVISGVKFANTDAFGTDEYEAIALKTSDDKNITVNNTVNGDPVYVIFTGWNLWWTTDKSYLIKKIGDWGSTLNDWWNSATYHRSYWAENPSGTELQKFPHNNATKKILTSGTWKGNNENYTLDQIAQYTAYCLENAAESGKGGLMKTYNPDTETTSRTLAYFGGVLVTIKDKVATELTLAEWASTRGTEESVMTRMFSSLQNQIYFKTKEPVSSTSESTETTDGTIISGTDNYMMIAVRLSDLCFVSGLESGLANSTAENSPRYLSFINLKTIKGENGNKSIAETKKTVNDTEYEIDGKLYKKSGDTYTEISIDDVNKLYQSVGGAKVWKDGAVYYYKEIEHLNTTDATGTKGKYGVVRNHIYEIQLNSVFGLGTPVLTPEDGSNPENWEDIIPQKPSHEYFLGARMNILSWRVVNNQTSLDW